MTRLSATAPIPATKAMTAAKVRLRSCWPIINISSFRYAHTCTYVSPNSILLNLDLKFSTPDTLMDNTHFSFTPSKVHWVSVYGSADFPNTAGHETDHVWYWFLAFKWLLGYRVHSEPKNKHPPWKCSGCSKSWDSSCLEPHSGLEAPDPAYPYYLKIIVKLCKDLTDSSSSKRLSFCVKQTIIYS